MPAGEAGTLTFLPRQVDELLLGMDAALAEDVAHVHAHGVERDKQRVADIGSAAPCQEQSRNLSLAVGERKAGLQGERLLPKEPV